MRRVVVTGLGCVTGCGEGVEPFWSAVRGGRPAVARVRLSRDPGRIDRAVQIDREALAARFDPAQLLACDPCTLLALLAAREALAQAGLAAAEVAGPRTAVILGCSIGGIETLDDGFHGFYKEGHSRLSPLAIPRIMANAPACHVSMAHGITGPVLAISTACASAAQAIGLGLMLVRSGAVERALVGGTDALITAGMMRAWASMRVLTPDACRPFSAGRNGMVLGEGAGILVIEAETAAAARGASALAVLAGYGTTSDAGDLLRPGPAGASAAMAAAIADAGLAPADIGYVNAHGTGTIANDSAESDALGRVFGAGLPSLPVSATKPVHGHALGAAGALELIATIMALRDGFAPPTINWLGPSPDCRVDAVPNEGRAIRAEAAMSNSFAFGGINASLVVTRA